MGKPKVIRVDGVEGDDYKSLLDIGSVAPKDIVDQDGLQELDHVEADAHVEKKHPRASVHGLEEQEREEEMQEDGRHMAHALASKHDVAHKAASVIDQE
eukprot:57091-Amorphochlora_amoeboformis.AAC.1